MKLNHFQSRTTATMLIMTMAILGGLLGAIEQASAKSSKPNVIVILSDDAGYADFSIHGSKQFQTPHIDSISTDGVRFSQGYVTDSVCSPSRAGLLTGRYQQRFGHEYNLGGHQPSDDVEYAGMRTDQVTLADAMKALGYHTGAIGKWHLGHLDKYHPINRGFDEFFGMRGGGASYFNQGSKIFQIERGMEVIKTPLPYLTDAFGDEACDFIKRNKEKPFFLYLAFNAVHTPMHAKKEDMAKFDFIKKRGRRTLGGMTLALDEQVGNVLQTLRDQGLEENTIVWFINDNGGTPLTNSSCNAPLNGMKGTVLEGGVRVLFSVKWPKGLPKGKVFDQPISSMDIFATSVAAAGGDAQQLVNQIAQQKHAKQWKAIQKRKRPRAGQGWKLDGVNLLSHLRGKKTDGPHPTLYWRRAKGAAIRDGDWKLVRLPDRQPMLYDLSKDISEQNNLSADQPQIVAKLMKKLFQWETQLAHPAWRTGTYWIQNNISLYDRQYQLTQPEK